MAIVRGLLPGKEGGEHEGVRGSARAQDRGVEVPEQPGRGRTGLRTGPRAAPGHAKVQILCGEEKPAPAWGGGAACEAGDRWESVVVSLTLTTI